MTFDEVWTLVAGNTQMAREEAALLYSYAEKTPDNSVLVELGTWRGGSACVIASAQSKSRVFTIDNFRTDTYPAGRWTEPEARDFIRKVGLPNITLLTGNNEDFVKLLNEKFIRFLFIDGDHRYESVKADIRNWLPRVVRGGVVLFHDYASHEGVLPAVDEFINAAGKLEKIEQVLSLLVTKKL